MSTTALNTRVIAIDGPAGTGKSSTARAVARELGFRHLDSGAFYRALTWAALEAALPPDRWRELEPAGLEALEVAGHPAGGGYRMTVRGLSVDEAIRSDQVNAQVSRMAAAPGVRGWLLRALRAAAEGEGLVADGRDIGTVVFPEAQLKVFLTCSPEVRARRRLREQGNEAATGEQIEAERNRLLGRDESDSGRKVAPLLRAPDALLLDTTDLPFDAQVRAVVRLAQARFGLDAPPRAE